MGEHERVAVDRRTGGLREKAIGALAHGKLDYGWIGAMRRWCLVAWVFLTVGLTLGMIGVIAIVGSGLQSLLFALPGAAPVVTVLAAAYFAYLAYRIATAPPLEADPDPAAAPRWFEGVLLSLVNPKAYAAMAAMFSGFVLIAGDPLQDGIVKAGVLVATLLTVNVAWLSIGTALTGLLRNPRTARGINMAFAVLLIISVIIAVRL